MGLLLLRAAVGLAILSQAGRDLSSSLDPSPATWILGGLAVLAGVLLLAGFMTPIAAAAAGLEAAAIWASLVPHRVGFPQSSVLAALLTALSVAIVLLGPGAFSIDARLFGLREIIIPRCRPDD